MDKVSISEGYESNDMAGVKAAALALNAAFTATKYVTALTASTANGSILVTYSGAHIPQVAGANTLVLAPYIGGAALVAGLQGAVDWGCASATNATITAHAQAAPPRLGSMLAKYVPTECK